MVRKTCATTCLIGFLSAFGPLLIAQDSVQRIQDVKRIYVDSFGSGENADLIRSKVITELVRSNQLEVVQTPDKADAVLTGGASVSVNLRGAAHATAGIQLVGKNEQILWADDISNSIGFGSRSSSLAGNIVKNLLKAISRAKNKSDSTKQR